MATPVLQVKRGAFSNLPGLRAGEPGFTTDKYDLFVGTDSNVNNNKFFGSHRYWIRENATNSLILKLVDKDGDNSVGLRSPNTVSSSIVYTLPGTITENNYLKTDSSGNLSWVNPFDSSTFIGIVTFTDTTDNNLGDENTGSVQLDGGMGIAKNLTVKQNLYVGGTSEFVGVVTFRGGTINLGDSDADNINISGEFVSNLIPNTDNTYSIGEVGKRWQNATFAGVGTFGGGASLNDIEIGTSVSNKINSTSGGLTLDSADGLVTIDDNLTIVGYTTISGNLNVNGGQLQSNAASFNLLTSSTTLNFATSATSVSIGSTTGNTTINNSAVVDGTLRINGNEIRASDNELNITMTSNTLTAFSGDIQVGTNNIKASNGSTNITLTDNTLTTFAGDIKVFGNDIQSSDGSTAITMSATNVSIGGSLTVGGNDIKASDGTTALTLADTTGAITAANDLTVTGNLYVNGSTTQINTTSIAVEDRTIDIGVVDGNAPTSATTWDLGVLFNYYDTESKKSAVIWEHSNGIFQFASVLASDSNGTDVNTPQLSVATFAPIEIGALWVNDCAGSSQVISCSASERFLNNITIDAGTF